MTNSLKFKEILDIFQSECNYVNINKNSKVKLRNRTDGIQLKDLFYYRFMYSKKDTTKESIISQINFNNNTNFTRQAYESKENNIPVSVYANIYNKICCYYNCYCNNENNFKLVAIDGTYNNNNKMKEVLNMGYYNITDEIPINIVSDGHRNKNQEVKLSTKFIKKNINLFKNKIIVADRAYFTYDHLDFLNKNNLKFIIRIKGEGDKLNKSNILKTNTPDYTKIMDLRNNTRVIKYNNILEKTIYASNSKKTNRTHKIEIKNNCNIITNLLDEVNYADEKIMELYKSRWDIEVFFKYIKYNFKFQHIKENQYKKFQKMYLCELIITYIAKIIEKDYMKKNNIITSKRNTKKINKSNLIKGIFNVIIYNILDNKLSCNEFNKFTKSYIKINSNIKDRSFPRTSKTPFTKWYIKGYSNQTKYMKIIDAIINKSVNSLNKNLKTIAKLIISIDGKSYKPDENL